jgi:hypothetical protein
MAGTETRQKSMTTTLRLTPEEHSAVVEAAARRGIGPSTFARIVVLRAAGRKPVAPRRRRDSLALALGAALGDLGRVGGLLNQLAKKANQGAAVPRGELASLEAEVRRLTAAVMALEDAREPAE